MKLQKDRDRGYNFECQIRFSSKRGTEDTRGTHINSHSNSYVENKQITHELKCIFIYSNAIRCDSRYVTTEKWEVDDWKVEIITFVIFKCEVVYLVYCLG